MIVTKLSTQQWARWLRRDIVSLRLHVHREKSARQRDNLLHIIECLEITASAIEDAFLIEGIKRTNTADTGDMLGVANES